jgi:hypothetical protein
VKITFARVFDYHPNLGRIADRETLIEFATACYTGRQLTADHVIDHCGGDKKYVERDDRCPQGGDLPGYGERYKTEGKQGEEQP